MTKNDIIHSDIANSLVEMAKKDQAMRFSVQDSNTHKKIDKNIDRENLKQLKEIVAKIGWPTKSTVGEIAAHAAWLIVQHGDFDVEFQKECLSLMKKSDDICNVYVAYLTDRIEVNEGREQIFGTQFHMNDSGEIEPRPIKNIEELDKRRQEVGMSGFEEYRNKMHGNYPTGYEQKMIGPFGVAD